MPGLSGILTIGVPFYIMLLTTMAWRAIARVQFFDVSHHLNLNFIKFKML